MTVMYSPCGRAPPSSHSGAARSSSRKRLRNMEISGGGQLHGGHQDPAESYERRLRPEAARGWLPKECDVAWRGPSQRKKKAMIIMLCVASPRCACAVQCVKAAKKKKRARGSPEGRDDSSMLA
ncbi:hypothetical protein MRX96_013606 [Rhipicephalus microplus]